MCQHKSVLEKPVNAVYISVVSRPLFCLQLQKGHLEARLSSYIEENSSACWFPRIGTEIQSAIQFSYSTYSSMVDTAVGSIQLLSEDSFFT